MSRDVLLSENPGEGLEDELSKSLKCARDLGRLRSTFLTEFFHDLAGMDGKDILGLENEGDRFMRKVNMSGIAHGYVRLYLMAEMI